MSQSSTSSQRSRDVEPRKRKPVYPNTSSPHFSQAKRRRKNTLSLKRGPVGRLVSQSSTDSFAYQEDNDSIITVSSSAGSEASHGPKRKSTKIDYELIVAKFNVNEDTVKKHYEIIKKQPVIPLQRVCYTSVLSNADLWDPVEVSSHPLKPPPEFNKRRIRRSRRKSDIKSTSCLSENKAVNKKSTQILNDSSELSKLQPSTSKKKVLNKRAESNITRYFQSFSSVKQKELITPDTSLNQNFGQSNLVSPRKSTEFNSKSYNIEFSDSSDEFEISRTSSGKIKRLSEKQKELVSNPFSNKEQMTQEDLTKNDYLKNKKKLIKQFTKKGSENKEESIVAPKEDIINYLNYSEKESGKEITVPDIEINPELSKRLTLSPPLPDLVPAQIEDIKESFSSTKTSRKRKRIKFSETSSSSGENLHEKSFNSITVNCEPMASISRIRVDSDINEIINNEVIGLPLPFGCDHFKEHEEQNEFMEMTQNDIDSDQGDLCIVSDDELEKRELDFDNLNHSNTSLDLFDDVMDFGSISPELKEDRSSPLELNQIENIKKSKGKPKIKSISEVDYTFIKSRPDKYQSNSSTTNSKEYLLNGSETPRKINETCIKLDNIKEENEINSECNSIMMKSDDVAHNLISLNTTTPRGPKSDLSHVKKNLRNYESIKTPEINQNDIEINKEGTFNNNCNKVIETVEPENTDTCENDEKESSNKENEKEILQMSDDKSQGSENCANNNTTKFENAFKPAKSTIGRIPRLSLSLKKKTSEKTLNEGKSAPVTPVRSQHQQELTNIKRITSQITAATQRNSSILSSFGRRIISDPRCNKTVGPTIFENSHQRDPRLNRSLSSVKTSEVTIADPRLVRGQSRPKYESSPERSIVKSEDVYTSNFIDPRLRKRREREEAEKVKLIKKKEEAEKAAMLAKELEEADRIIEKRKRELSEQDMNDDIIFVPSNELNRTQPLTVQNRRSSAFERLGDKVDLTEKRANEENELKKIVKSRKRSVSPTKSDDDALSLHANDYWSSDEDSNHSSPRHRKFVSERTRQLEEAKADQLQQQQQQQQQHIPKKIITIKDRLSLRNSSTLNTMQSTSQIPLISVRSRLGTTALPVKAPVQERLGINVRRQPVQAFQAVTRMTTTAMPQSARQAALTSSIANALKNPAYTQNNEDSYFKMNAEQMMQDVDNLMPEDFGTETYVTFGNDIPDTNTVFDERSILDGANEPAVIGVKKGQCDKKSMFFKQYCFKTLRKGRCPMQSNGNCLFRHDINILQMLIKNKKHELFLILEDATVYNFVHFINLVWKDILPILEDQCFSVFEKFYNCNIRSEHLIQELFMYYLSKDKVNHTIEVFVKKIAPVIDINDRDTVRTVCILIKGSLRDGFCWETIKPLGQKAVPPLDMVELTLLQCIKRKKNQAHIMEVYDMIKTRMGMMERNEINQNLLKEFYNLVQSKRISNEGSEIRITVPLMFGVGAHANSDVNSNGTATEIKRSVSIDSIKSADSSDKESTRSNSLALKKSAGQTNVQPNNSPVEIETSLPNKGENIREYRVGEQMDWEETSGAVGRDVFWEFYLKVDSVNKGLEKKNYRYVWRTLNEISQEKVPHELLRRAYFHILCKEIKKCQRHIEEIIKTAVRWTSAISQKTLDMLFEVGVMALIELGNNELWVMALQLLNWVKIIEPKELKTEFILISAEIYLANYEPLEALFLLQKTKVIRTHRDEWLAKDSLRSHEKHRNKLISLLLKALSFVDLERAVYLFKSLLADQAVLYYPIDLQGYLDKLILLLILHKQETLILDMCRLSMDFDLTFQKPTYQELISYLLSIDEVLANQVLDYAIALGYYNDIKIRGGFTTMIIDMNYYEEEIYIMLKRLIRKIQINVGPVIPRLKPNQLRVILVFEDIPSDRRLYTDNLAVRASDRYRTAKNTIGNILATRFHPPIRVSQVKTDKFCKLISKTVVDYLKHWNK